MREARVGEVEVGQVHPPILDLFFLFCFVLFYFGVIEVRPGHDQEEQEPQTHIYV